MSTTKLLEDLKFGTEKEIKIKELLEKAGYTVEMTENMAIHDFLITKDNTTYSLELKTRRCGKDQYPDTLIGANKVAEARQQYYKKGIETMFLFQFTDGLFYINPLDQVPRREFKAFRWDRGDIDGKKGWCLYNVESLKEIINS